ncbi:CU044_5270 family protein [Nocardioides hungaricus]
MTRRTDVDEDDERFRQELIAHGIRVQDASPLPGDDARVALELTRILALPRRKPPLLRRLTSAASSRRTWRIALPVLATVSVLVAVFVVVVQPGGRGYVAEAGTPPLLRLSGVQPGSLPASGEPAGDTLRELAATALRLPYDAAQPVQQVVVDSWLSESAIEIGGGPVRSVLRSVQRASYFLPDDTFRSIERRGEPLDQDGRITTPIETGGPSLTDESFASPDPGADYAESLPTEPTALRDALLDGFDPTTLRETAGGALLGQVTALTSSYVLPPRLLSAILEVLAGEPGITLLGTTHDRLDREALVLSAPAIDGYSQQLLLVDPDTGAILGDEVVLVRPSDSYSFTPPAVTAFNTIARSERIGFADLPAAPPRSRRQ